MTDVTLFTTKPSGGGAEKVSTSLAKQFSENGIETDFLVLDRGEAAFDAGDANIVEIPHSRTRYVVPWLVRYLNDASPEAIFSTLTGPNLVTIAANSVSRTNPTVIVREATVRSQSARSKESTKERVMNAGIRYLYPRADHVVTISQQAGKDMRQFLRGSGNRVVTIPNPVDVENIRRQAEEPVSHAWFTDEYNVVIGVGRLVPVKDFKTLIRAFDAYSDNDDRLIILGEGSERKSLEGLVDREGIDGVDFLGYVDNPYRYMKRADVFVSTSKYEGFGNAIVEALACGTPVIATNCPGGPREILDDGTYGELAPVGDIDRIAELISEVLGRETDSHRLVVRARDFSIETIAARYLELI